MKPELLTFLQSVNYPLHEQKVYGHGWTEKEASRRMFYVSKVVTNKRVLDIAHGFFKEKIEKRDYRSPVWKNRYEIFERALQRSCVRFHPEKYNNGWKLYIFDKETFIFGILFGIRHLEPPYYDYDGTWFDWVDVFCQNEHRICNFDIVLENIKRKRAVRFLEDIFLQWLYRPSGQHGMGVYTKIAQESFQELQESQKNS